MEELQIEYNTVAESGRINWKKGEFCCFKSSKDEMWYRGTVLDVNDDKTVQVRIFHLFVYILLFFIYLLFFNIIYQQIYFVDFGKTATVPVKDVAYLEERFKLLATCCLKCFLPNIVPAGDGKTWSCVTSEFLTEYLKEHEDQLYLKRSDKLESKGEGVPINLQVKEVILGSALDGTKTFYVDVAKKLVDEGLALPGHM